LTSNEVVFPLEFLEPPNPDFLRQGDVVADVPLIVAPPKITLVDKPARDSDRLSARVLDKLESGQSAYAIVQVTITDAVILTYDCDLDPALYHVRDGRAPDASDLITVAAATEPRDFGKDQLRSVREGKMPRYAYLPESTKWPARIIDFSTIQQIDIRELLPRAVRERRFGLTEKGQLRLLEALAQVIGDVFRRERNGPGDPRPLIDAFKTLTKPSA